VRSSRSEEEKHKTTRLSDAPDGLPFVGESESARMNVNAGIVESICKWLPGVRNAEVVDEDRNNRE
jgi:hypothetical protein